MEIIINSFRRCNIMNRCDKVNPFQISPSTLRRSRYDYDSVLISHDGITRGTENGFKESR